MCSMRTDSGAQDGAVPPAAASDERNAEASPPASPEQIYKQVMVHLAVITEEWQKARDALLRDSRARPRPSPRWPGAPADENPSSIKAK